MNPPVPNRRDYFAAHAPAKPADWFQFKPETLPQGGKPVSVFLNMKRQQDLDLRNAMLRDIQWRWAWADAMMQHEPRRDAAPALPAAAKRP